MKIIKNRAIRYISLSLVFLIPLYLTLSVFADVPSPKDSEATVAESEISNNRSESEPIPQKLTTEEPSDSGIKELASERAEENSLEESSVAKSDTVKLLVQFIEGTTISAIEEIIHNYKGSISGLKDDGTAVLFSGLPSVIVQISEFADIQSITGV